MTMDCIETRQRLHPYLDREIDVEGALAVESHLAGCAACRSLFAAQQALQAGVRRHATYFGAPPGLAQRVRREAGRGPAARFGWLSLRQWLPLGAAVAATALLTWTAALQYAGMPGEERIAEQVVNGHARAVMTAHRIDVASSDRHTVKPWLSSRLDFSPPVVDLASAGFPLDGGRLDYLDGRTVATLCYRSRQHWIDLFVWPERDARGDRAARTSSRQGYNIVTWRTDGMAFWAISDVNADDLKAFVEAYVGAKQG
jgi:anti-sigma factor RsiW